MSKRFTFYSKSGSFQSTFKPIKNFLSRVIMEKRATDLMPKDPKHNTICLQFLMICY